MDIRGFPTSLPEFQRVFPDDAACARYLETIRWPDGFSCPKCALARRAIPLRNSLVCRVAMPRLQGQHVADGRNRHAIQPHAAVDVVLGRVSDDYASSRTIGRPVPTPACAHSLRDGVSDSPQAARWHGPPRADAIGGEHPVEVDECLIGGETRGEGRGVHHKSLVVGAVEVRSRQDDGKKRRRRVYAGRLRLRVVPDRSAERLPALSKTTWRAALSCALTAGPATPDFPRWDIATRRTDARRRPRQS